MSMFSGQALQSVSQAVVAGVVSTIGQTKGQIKLESKIVKHIGNHVDAGSAELIARNMEIYATLEAMPDTPYKVKAIAAITKHIDRIGDDI